jgi:enoyl-CoA hydratase/carnithine racemase
MAYELLILERLDNGVAVLTLSNGKVNALSGALVAEIGAAAQELTDAPPAALIVSGGDRIFALAPKSQSSAARKKPRRSAHRSMQRSTGSPHCPAS